MEVSKISTNIRFSKDIGGSWKGLELGAEADVTIMDDWTVCQAELYSQLCQQLRQLWHTGNGAALYGTGSTDKAIQPPAASEPAQTPREHWCYPHNMEWKRRTKNGMTWYSHRQGKGWCSEPEPAERG